MALARKKSKTQKAIYPHSWRISLIYSMVFLVLLTIFMRVSYLQVFEHANYVSQAQNQRTRTNELVGDRGEIYLQDIKTGEVFPVAVNKRLYDVALDPRLIYTTSVENKARLQDIITRYFPDISSEKVQSILGNTQDQWELIAKNVDESIVKEIQGNSIKGFVFDEKKERFYPENTLAAHVLGFVQKDNLQVGQYGIEQEYNELLKGENGFEKKEIDAKGGWLAIGERQKQSATDGANLILTIDHTIQYKLEETLLKVSEEFKTKRAMGIIMDPKTGEIYAMASNPTFDLNNYGKVQDASIYTNPLISNLYEPGSIFKTFTVGIGLEKKVITPNTLYEDRGEITINGFTVKNALEKAYGTQSVAYALEKSLNLGMIFIQQKVGRDGFVEGLLDDFQLDDTTGIDLPNEVPGNFNNIQKSTRDARDINYATASYGQGVSLNLLRVLTSFSSVVNGGNIMKPYIVKEIQYPDGNTDTIEPQVMGQAMSQETANTLANMLVEVVDNASGNTVKVDGYSLGGKTGTAQIAIKGGYGDDTLQSFVQFATLTNPRYTLLISVDSPQGSRFADVAVVPKVKELNSFLLNYFEIESDKE